MPSIVGGPFKINSNSGVVNFGDSLNISPKAATKSFSGSGAGNTGDFIMTNNGVNANTNVDPDLSDQNASANV
ncbi:spore germination protein [Desertibacillus haloalkaliphilus]|uniref:spore germination protein n=1 Tax=Desertibacillus haloalkaliphilus TaxID=1328930 RepID=UPI001C276A22|nr:spore germination protein [Desertibacillus haloalkaliphilus]MBU8907908.1 spore germination protein [Desertibacillus haloalkaliphilus]